MSMPLLRTNVTGTIEIPHLPEVIVSQLEESLAESFNLFVDDGNADMIHFEIKRRGVDKADFTINGTIQRWEGNHARIDYEGNVHVPPAKQLRQKGIIALLVGIWTIIFWMDFGAQFTENPLVPSLFLIPEILAWGLVTAIIIWFGSGILSRDNNSTKRWQAQQAMTQVIDTLKQLETISLGDTDREFDEIGIDTVSDGSSQYQQKHSR